MQIECEVFIPCCNTWEDHDKKTGFKERIIALNLVTAPEIKEIDQSVKKEIESAVKLARTDPEPPREDMAMYIYSEGTNGELVRGSDLFTTFETNGKM